VAGVHFPKDMEMGKDLGKQLALYFIHMSTKAVAGDATAVQWLWGKAKAEWA
jgi:hypothetical protein